jgi:sec-independent protein translocase protein TatC
MSIPFQIRDIDETQAPLLDHLIELRARLMRCIAALAVTFGVCLYFVDPIFAFLLAPLRHAFKTGQQGHLIYTGLYEGFFVDLKVALFAAAMLSFPVIANQLWAFVAPGLYAKEKRAFLPFLIATPILFLSGAALAYFAVMPAALHFLLGFGGTHDGITVEAMPSIGDYLSTAMQFIIVFGVGFLLPVLLLLLNRAGVVTRAQLVKMRRYAIVGIVAIAAVLTPPDVGSQLMLAVPMLVLFEGSLIIMWLGERKAAKVAATEATAETPAP